MATILIAEDDPDICDLIQFKLESVGHEVVVEHDGERALATAERTRPDLILLDWMMPKMTGLEVCVAIRRHPALDRTPIVVLTAKAQEADVQRGFRAGANDYILKPFSPRELATRVEALLARSYA